jgi:CBS domain-containing protein
MIAADIMHKDVITVRENQTVKELARILLDARISGAPVLNHSGKLVGVVSQTDLVRSVREDAQPHEAPAYHQDVRWLGSQGFQVETPEYHLVRDVMTPAVISADVEAPVVDVARLMAGKHIHRVIITHRGRLAGIVTSMDILKAFVGLAGPARGAHA